MALEGVWTSEIYGLFGWENTGVLMLKDGHAVGGGNNHVSVGTYSIDESEVQMLLEIEYHGPPRTMFGAAEKKLKVALKGKTGDGVVEGVVHRSDKPDLSLSFRLTRRGALP